MEKQPPPSLHASSVPAPEESLLELVSVAAQHVACRCLLLEGRDADVEALVAGLERRNVVVLLFFLVLLLIRHLKVVLLTGGVD